MIRIIDAILSIKSNAQVSCEEEDINKLTWHDGNPTNITNEQILAKQTELNADYDSKEYQRKRKAEYPTIEELVVALYDTNDKADIETKRAAVKAKYPKPA